MKHNLVIGIFIAIISAGVFVAMSVNSPAQARKSTQQTATQKQSATFEIENMTCAVCPITVKKAMQSVEGVKSVNVDFDAKTATVTFDSSLTTTEEIGEASTNAGFPAAPKG